MYRTQSLPLGAAAPAVKPDIQRRASLPTFPSLNFGSVAAARAHYQSSQPTHIQVVVVVHMIDNEKAPVKVPLSKLKGDCFYLIAYNQLRFTATPWGYFDRIGMKYMGVEDEQLVVFHSNCWGKPRAAIGMQERQMHESFDMYVSWPTGEPNLAYIEEALRRRIVMYMAKEDDNEVVMLRDAEGVHMDNTSYHIILASLFHNRLRIQEVKKHWYLLTRWLELENSIVQRRMSQMTFEHMLRMLHDCYKVNVENAPSGFATLYDKETECYKMPFEAAAPLLKGRRAVLKGGYAYVQRLDIQYVLQHTMRRLNQLNSDKAAAIAARGGFEPLFDDKRMSGFALGVIRHLCHITQANVGVSPQMQLNVKQISTHSPSCMQALLSRAYNLNDKNHLRNNDRVLLGIYMMQNGVSRDAIVDGWSIKMRNVYELNQYPKEVKSLYGTLQWAETKRGGTPLACKQLMTAGYCPFGTTCDAQRRCGAKYEVVTKNPSHYLQVALEHDK